MNIYIGESIGQVNNNAIMHITIIPMATATVIHACTVDKDQIPQRLGRKVMIIKFSLIVAFEFIQHAHYI